MTDQPGTYKNLRHERVHDGDVITPPLGLRPPPVSPAGATLDEQPQDLPTSGAKDVILDD